MMFGRKEFEQGIQNERWNALMAALDDLKAAVEANTTAVQAAVAKLGTIAGAVAAADVETQVTQINTNNAALTAATNQ